MKAKFNVGAIVKWNRPGGSLSRILDYRGDGFYLVETIPDKMKLMAHEDQIVIPDKKEKIVMLGDKYLEVSDSKNRSFAVKGGANLEPRLAIYLLFITRSDQDLIREASEILRKKPGDIVAEAFMRGIDIMTD